MDDAMPLNQTSEGRISATCFQLPSPTGLQKYQDFSSFLIPTLVPLGADLRTAMPLPLQSEPTNSTCFT